MKRYTTVMRQLAFIWGVGGVIALLGFAIYRLYPFVKELTTYELSGWQLVILIAWSGFMLLTEGLQAFGKQFSPRVVARAQYLRHETTWQRTLLAPIFSIGYFAASQKRIITSVSLIAGIITLVVLIHFIPQPWRGIIDTGVILGLGYGIGSLLYFTYKALRNPDTYVADPEVVD